MLSGAVFECKEMDLGSAFNSDLGGTTCVYHGVYILKVTDKQSGKRIDLEARLGNVSPAVQLPIQELPKVDEQL